MADKLIRPQMISHHEVDCGLTIHSVAWVPSSPRLLAVGTSLQNTGVIQVYTMGRELSKAAEINIEHGLNCVTFRGSSLIDRRLAVGDFGGRVYSYDFEEGKEVWGLRGHEVVNCIAGAGGRGSGPAEIVSGGREGSVKVWDVRVASRPVVHMEPESVKRECWAVTFGNCYNDSERMLCAGYDNGDVKMWDLRNMSLYWDTNVGNGVCGLEFDRQDIKMNKLSAVTLEGGLHVWDCSHLSSDTRKMAEVRVRVGQSTVWVGRQCPDNREVMLTGSGAGTLSLYQYKYPDKRVTRDQDGNKAGVPGSLTKLQSQQISDQPINCLDWSPDKLGLLVTSAFDQRIRIVIVTKLNLL